MGDPGLSWKLRLAVQERAVAFDIEGIADQYLDLYGYLGAGRS